MVCGPHRSDRGILRDRVPMTSRLPKDWAPPAARGQSGVFTAAQARAGGATSAQVRRRRQTGLWRPVVGGALALPSVAIDAWTQAQAAAITWPDAVVGLASAAALHRLPVPESRSVHVIVPNRRPSRGGLVTHELDLDPGDVTTFGLARVTTLPRTLFDCIGRLPRAESESLVVWAVTRDLLDRSELERAVRARPRSWGNAQRCQALADSADGAFNAAERRLHAILRRAQITGWAGDQRLYQGSKIMLAWMCSSRTSASSWRSTVSRTTVAWRSRRIARGRTGSSQRATACSGSPGPTSRAGPLKLRRRSGSRSRVYGAPSRRFARICAFDAQIRAKRRRRRGTGRAALTSRVGPGRSRRRRRRPAPGHGRRAWPGCDRRASSRSPRPRTGPG